MTRVYLRDTYTHEYECFVGVPTYSAEYPNMIRYRYYFEKFRVFDLIVLKQDMTQIQPEIHLLPVYIQHIQILRSF